MEKAQWTKKLLTWFDQEQRILPWRGTKDLKVAPWQIWVSEIMLQQTTVATVTPRYHEFMKRFPSFLDLAQANQDDILHFWQGLGYYSRAKNLHKAAQIIQDDYQGKMPQNYQALKKLPGLGSYTAAAIASIAFEEKVPAVDGNVARVYSRFWCLDQMGEPLKKEIFRQLQNYMPNRAGDFNQASIELGALICKPKNPKCDQCPIALDCQAFQKGQTSLYPKKAPKKAKEKCHGDFYLIEDEEGQIMFIKRPEKGLLSELYVLPSNDWYKDGQMSWMNKISDQEERRQFQKSFEHIFTHIHLYGNLYHLFIKGEEKRFFNEALWIQRDEIHQLALPTMIKKAMGEVR